MSHIATLKVQITDLDALEVAAGKFAAELRRNVHDFKAYPGTQTRCQHVISLKGDRVAYEIGLRQLPQSAEGYEFAFDTYDGKLERAFGAGMTQLRNEYTAVVAERQLARRGWRTRRDVDTKQEIRVVGVR